jgi:hypothetical protein
MSLLTILAMAFKPVILPILTALVGWVLPSPQQLLANKEAATHQAEQSGEGLDNLP